MVRSLGRRGAPLVSARIARRSRGVRKPQRRRAVRGRRAPSTVGTRRRGIRRGPRLPGSRYRPRSIAELHTPVLPAARSCGRSKRRGRRPARKPRSPRAAGADASHPQRRPRGARGGEGWCVAWLQPSGWSSRSGSGVAVTHDSCTKIIAAASGCAGAAYGQRRISRRRPCAHALPAAPRCPRAPASGPGPPPCCPAYRPR